MQVYGEDSYQPDSDKAKEKVRYSLSSVNCLILFLVGFVGLQFISVFVQLIYVNTPLYEVVAEGETSIKNTFWLNFLTYLITCPLMVLLYWVFDKKGFKRTLKNFAIGSTYIIGAVFLLILIVSSDIYSLIENAIKNAAGISSATNQNQSTLIGLIGKYPVAMIIETVIFAPIVEEITYRQGLFELIRRKSRVWAYIVVSIVFGLIHVSDALISGALANTLTTQIIWTELLALPTYAIGGAVLAASYEKTNSISSSIITHSLENLLACISILATSSLSSSSSVTEAWIHLI